MSIVDDVARMIDPGAFTEWHELGTHEDSQQLRKSRRAYMQSHAVRVAVDILKLVVGLDQETLRKMLVDDEIARWSAMGVPADSPEGRRIVEAKYSVPLRTKARKSSATATTK